ncbi:MAG TPA: alpha/beta hydrolase [Rhodocyclaceae bacterium]|nr:alpha/beta hydrolase [Rhodocyclaceae bacterium]
MDEPESSISGNIIETIKLKGGEKAVLLLHGLYGNPLEMHYLGRRLKRAGYTVWIPYIRGCGVADHRKLKRVARWEDWLGAVESAFDALRREHKEISVGGLCIGADLALALAEKRGPDVHALCLYATTLYYDGWNLTRWRALRGLAYYTPLRYVLSFHERPPYGLKDERVRTWIAAQMERGGETAAGAARSPMTGVYQAERLMRYLRPRLGRITVPTLILHAREDDTASLRSADLVEKHIGASIVRKVILENSYHIITMDNDKDRVLSETLDFISVQGRNMTDPAMTPQAA